MNWICLDVVSSLRVVGCLQEHCEHDAPAKSKYSKLLIEMGIVENSTVRFGSRFCFYGSVLSRFPKRFINDISWIRYDTFLSLRSEGF